MRIPVFCAAVLVIFFPGLAFAAHPLITDDAGTQGKGKFQVEMTFEHQRETGEGATEWADEFKTTITYGAFENIDLVVGIPVDKITADSGVRSSAAGLSDISLEVKWRFFESEGLSLALKPGISIPSGDSARGLGAGELGPSMFFIATKELDPFAFHVNIGYARNSNEIGEKEDIWHTSAAAEYKALNWLRLVANAGAEGSREQGTDTPEAFILGGFIFSVADNLDLDVGAKGIYTDSSDGYSILGGITYKF